MENHEQTVFYPKLMLLEHALHFYLWVKKLSTIGEHHAKTNFHRRIVTAHLLAT